MNLLTFSLKRRLQGEVGRNFLRWGGTAYKGKVIEKAKKGGERVLGSSAVRRGGLRPPYEL